MNFETLYSKEDSSVNFVHKISSKEALECRFVQRNPENFIIYLSSMTGCDKSCRMCHLTQNRQTIARNTTYEEFIYQVDKVLSYAVSNNLDTKKIHVNFMARGEPLDNPVINKHLLDDIALILNEKEKRDIDFKISTILPINSTLSNFLFNPLFYNLEIYYSLYSVSEEFRKKWLPKAHQPKVAFNLLQGYQLATNNRIVLHYALIDGQNDSLTDAKKVLDYVGAYKLSCDLNLIRYNSFDSAYQESKNFDEYANYMLTTFPGRVKIVPRVGFDIKASCGMFV